MANTKVTQHVIANNAITADQLASAAVTDAKLHSTLDLSGKTLTLPATAIPSASTATTQAASDNSTKLATTAYVTTAISNLVDSSPSSLNTLNELAAALNDDASFSTTVTNSIATKAPLANPTFTTAINGADNVLLQLGSSQDLQIWHDATNTNIKNSTGDLNIRADIIRLKSADGGEEYASFVDNSLVTLNFDNVEKLRTADYGVQISGTGALKIPVGTTGQRPTAATGQIRWNSTDGAIEVYNGSAWTAVGTGSSNKVLNTFTGDGSTTTFTLTVTPANEDALMVFIDGAYQEAGDYVLTNNQLALDVAPLSGEKVSAHITTASVHDGTSAVNQQFTGDGSTTAFTLSQDPDSENNTQIYINGVYQQKTDYTVTGTTLTFDTAPANGDIIEVNMFTVATLGNTDTVTEGVGNLYHTTARARGAISVSGNAISYNSSTGVLTANFEEGPVFTSSVQVSGNNHLGIGGNDFNTTAGTNTLTVGTVGSTTGGIQLFSPTNGEHWINWGDTNSSTGRYMGRIGYNHTDNKLMFYSSGTQKMVIDSSGQVGIGGINPGQTLEIHNSNASDYTDFGLRGTGHKYVIGVGNDSVATVNDKWYLYDNDNTAFRMVVDTSGNVGIGTTTPGAMLDIKGNTTTYGGMAKIYLTDSNSNSESRNWAIGNGGSGYGHFTIGRSNSKDGDPMASGTHTVPFMIDHQDNVGIGMTPTPAVGAPLQIASSGTGYVGLRLNGSGSAGVWDLYSSYSGGKYMFGIYDRANTSYALVATEDGHVGIGTESPYDSAWGTSSRQLAVSGTNYGVLHLIGTSIPTRFGIGAGDGKLYLAYDDVAGEHRIIVTNTGNVAMGTETPDANSNLHIHSSGNTQLRLTTSSGANTPTAQMSYSAGSGYFLRLADGANNEDVMLRTYGDSVINGGAVTMSQQPGFLARGNTSQWLQGYSSSWNTIVAGIANADGSTWGVNLTEGATGHWNGYDAQSDFNTSNGRFTAPVDGKYHIHGNVYCAKVSSNANDYMHFLVYVNGQQINQMYTMGGHKHAYPHDFSLTISSILRLDANDYVEWKLYTTSTSVRIYGDHLQIGAHKIS